MSDNQKKLNEQLVKVVLDTKTCDEVRIKRAKYLIRLGANVNQKVNGKSLLKIAREKGYKEIEEVIKESLRKSFDELLDGDKFERVLDECRYANGHKVVVSKEKAIDLGRQFRDKNRNLKSAKEIEVLIQQGADLDVKDEYGQTALIEAVRKGKLDVVKCLVECGADLEAKDMHGRTALVEAVHWRQIEVVKYLAENGADVNAKEEDGDMALWWAAKYGHLEIVKCLVQNGADLEAKDKYGCTALIKAAENWHLEVVKYLVRLGANANQKVNGKSLLKIAREKGYKEVENVIKESLRKSFDELLDGDKFERVLDECRYANGHKVIVSKEKAIDLGKQFWNRNGDLKSAKEIEDLIQQGADVDVQVNKDKTALMIASYFGREDVVRILLEAGADVNIKGDDGWTALMIAVESGHKEIVEMLLDRGADVNQKNEHSTTALMIASYWGREDVVGILLEGGADVHQKNNDGETALMNASEKGRLDVVNILLEGGADVNQKDDNSKTALMKASNGGYNEIVQLLLEKGADVHQKDNDGETALMKATDKETKKVIKEHIKKTGGEPTNGGFLGKIFDGFGR